MWVPRATQPVKKLIPLSFDDEFELRGWHWDAIKLNAISHKTMRKRPKVWSRRWCINSIFTHSFAHKRTARCYTFWVWCAETVIALSPIVCLLFLLRVISSMGFLPLLGGSLKDTLMKNKQTDDIMTPGRQNLNWSRSTSSGGGDSRIGELNWCDRR